MGQQTVIRLITPIAPQAATDHNINLMFLCCRLEDCLELLCKSNRLPEAAFLARTYLPNHVSRIVQLWKEDLAQTNKKAADSLADPTQYENLFPDLQEAIKAEKVCSSIPLQLRKLTLKYFNLHAPRICNWKFSLARIENDFIAFLEN